MLIGCADKQDLVSAGSIETSAGIGWEHRANEIAQMLYAIDVRQGGSDEVTTHVSEAALV
jgi:hypothetical protein